MTHLLKEIKTKINKWGLSKLKSLYIANKTINKMKRQPSDWEKIFTNKAMDKGIISKIHNSSCSSLSKKKKKHHQGKKWTETKIDISAKKRYREPTNS